MNLCSFSRTNILAGQIKNRGFSNTNDRELRRRVVCFVLVFWCLIHFSSLKRSPLRPRNGRARCSSPCRSHRSASFRWSCASPGRNRFTTQRPPSHGRPPTWPWCQELCQGILRAASQQANTSGAISNCINQIVYLDPDQLWPLDNWAVGAFIITCCGAAPRAIRTNNSETRSCH